MRPESELWGSATITSNFAGRMRKTCARAATERSRLTQRGFPPEGVIGLQSKEQRFSATFVPLVTRKGHSLQQHSISKLMIERSLRGAASERRLGTRRARAQVLGAFSFFSCVRLTLSRLPREFSFRVPFWIRPPSSLPPDAQELRIATIFPSDPKK